MCLCTNFGSSSDRELHVWVPLRAEALDVLPPPPCGSSAVPLQLVQVVLVDVPGDVAPVEARSIKLLDLRVHPEPNLVHVLQVLIHESVRPEILTDLVNGLVSGDELLRGRHVHAVDVGVPDRGRSRRKVDLFGPGSPDHLDNLGHGGSPDDGVVHQQDLLALEDRGHGVQLPPHAQLPQVLLGHDEGPAHVPILHEALPVGQPELGAELDGHGPGAVRHGDHDIHVPALRGDLLGELPAQLKLELVHGYVVQHAVRPGKVDVLKDARGELGLLGAHRRDQVAALGHDDHLAGLHVPHPLIADGPERAVLAGKDVLVLCLAIHGEGPLSQNQGPDPVWVPEPNEADALDERDAAVRALHLLHQLLACLEDDGGDHLLLQVLPLGHVGLAEVLLVCPVDGVRPHVQQDLRVAVGTQTPVEEGLGTLEPLPQVVRVRDVPVVDEEDPERGVHEEGLGLRGIRGAGGGVPDVTDPNVPGQLVHHRLAVEDVLDEAVVLLLHKVIPVGGHHARRVLAPVLKHEEALVQLERRGALCLEDPDDPALASDVAPRYADNALMRSPGAAEPDRSAVWRRDGRRRKPRGRSAVPYG
mmetsp:Transcript_9878/g.35202  ORF Transcript_9878/g.35202 Transcript_9878/m.35202 type:complete len:587 (-) Transcript_9878:80-1840(-)